MAGHNATKVLPLTSQTKLTLTVALSLTDTVTVKFLRALRFTLLMNGMFRGAACTVRGRDSFLHYPAIALPVC